MLELLIQILISVILSKIMTLLLIRIVAPNQVGVTWLPSTPKNLDLLQRVRMI